MSVCLIPCGAVFGEILFSSDGTLGKLQPAKSMTSTSKETTAMNISGRKLENYYI